MITEDYCSYEVATLLKEKGFDGELSFNHVGYINSEKPCDCFCALAPTHQMAMKWLREVHRLHINVDVSPMYGKIKDEKGRNTCGLLYWLYMASGEWMNDKYNPQQKAFVVSGKSYKQAVEAALKYTFKNLI